MTVNIDAILSNADWPKRTPDKFADLEKAQKFDPNQPRDKQGRWVTLYHGTRTGYVSSILKEGIRPGKEGLAWATESREEAQRFAEGLDYPNPTPDATVVEIHAPKSAFFFEKPLTPGVKPVPGTRVARFAGGVRPEWIKTKATVAVGDRQVEVVKPQRAEKAGDVLVPVDVAAFDQQFQREEGFYLGAGGKGGIGNRYERFGQYVASHDSIEAAEVTVQENGRIGFTNGRHRYAWLRDQGVTSLPVAMTPESLKHAKRYGYLSVKQAEESVDILALIQKKQWDESTRRRQPAGSSRGGEFAATLHGPQDALDSLLNGERVNIDPHDLHRFLEKTLEQPEDPNLLRMHVDGMRTFGDDGLGIERKDMPQIPKDHRANFLKEMREAGVEIIEDTVDPLSLKPSQNEVGARNVAEKLKKYEKGGRAFPPVLVSNEGRVLDGHHHWGMMVAFAIDHPQARMPVYRLNISTKDALGLMHAYDAKHNIQRKALGQKFDPNQPRDEQGQWTKSRETFVKAAIQRGEAHQVSEDEFLKYHFKRTDDAESGLIQSNAYERYEAGDLDFIHRKDFDTLLDTREVNGQTVEIRLQAEPTRYVKRTVSLSDAERERLYEEYEQEAKRLGTSPMMAGLDLGWDSEKYKALQVFDKRWRDSGEEFVRDAHGNLVYLTPEEVQAQGKPTVAYTVGAFVGDKAIGYAGDEFGASGVYLAREYQRHGLGLTLFKTYLEKSGRLAKGAQIGQMTYAGQELVRALHRQLVKEAASKKADPATGRYVTPFVSFEKQGNAQLQLIASLNASRLATWGFTAEAEVRGMARYRISAVLDGRTSDFCRAIDGKIFEVEDAREKVIEVLNVQNPDDLKVVQPWPKQTKAAIAEFKQMTPEELTERGLHIPPYHPYCRTICRVVPSSEGEEMEEVATIPEEAEVFQPVTQADLRELGVEATQEQVDQWNQHIDMTPVELLSKFSGMPPQEVMTKGQGVGTNPIRFDESGNIGFNVHGADPKGLEFALGAILDPFTGTYYLTKADLLKGNPKAELAFVKNLFSSLIEMGLKSSATSVAVGVGGNAAYYAKLGFLPDELEWNALRRYALEVDTMLPEVLASLAPDDALLVKHLLQDKSVGAMSALVDLPFTYQGKTIGEWLFGEATGTWALDLTDDVLVAQARAYLT